MANGLQFRDDENLAWWLTTTRKGRCVLRDAMTRMPAEMEREIVERNRTDYVLVKVWGDGWIEVFAEKHVRVQIVGLPATEDSETQRLAEELTDLSLKPPFAAVNWPSWKRATEYIPPYWSVREFIESNWWKENGKKLLDEIDEACEPLRAE